MTGAELFLFVTRRVAEAGVTVGAERTNELYDHITGARDDVKRELAIEFPRLLASKVTLEQDVTDDRKFTLPVATADPIAIVEVRELTTREPYDPSPNLDRDRGDYEWQSPREIRISEETDEGDGIQVVGVFQSAAIAVGTAEADIGLPTPCHRAIGLGAAMLALTVDEETDATIATGLYERELKKLRELYGNFDKQDGTALRHALMKTQGDLYGDMIY